MKKLKEKKTWEERFDEFGELFSFPFGLTNSVMGYKFEKDGSNSPISGKCDTEEIKSFLSNVISQTEKSTREKTIREIGSEIQKVIQDSKATFFTKSPDVEPSLNDALYELKAEISDNVGMYFYNQLKS